MATPVQSRPQTLALRRKKHKAPRTWAVGLGWRVNPEIKLTKFEQLQAKLGLNDRQVPYSRLMRDWAARHRHSRYVPEELLLFWGLEVHENSIGAEIGRGCK